MAGNSKGDPCEDFKRKGKKGQRKGKELGVATGCMKGNDLKKN